MAGILTAAVASTFGANADPYFEYTTLLLPGNGTNGAQNNTFLDGSTNNFTITRNGNTTQGTFSPFSQTGWGNYFDGTGDYLSIADNAALEFGSSDFTLEFWYYPIAEQNLDAIITKGWPTLTGSWLIAQSSVAGRIDLYASTNGSSWDIANAVALGTGITLNAWHHVVMTRSGNTLGLFVDGVRGNTVNVTAKSFQNNTSNLTIGAGVAGSNEFNGYISNLRMVVGSSVYDPTQTTLTVPTSPLTAITNTSLLTCQSNRFIDNSTNNFTITRNGDTRVVAFSPFNPTESWSAETNGGSGYFDGTGDKLTVAANTALQFGTGDFCIEFWLYPVLLSSYQTPIDMGYNGSGSYVIQTGNGNGIPTFYTAGSALITSSTAWTANSFNHIVVCRSGTTLSMFINGSRTATASNSTNFNSNSTLGVGAAATASPDYPINGYMSNVRIVKGTALYDPTLTTLTVPTAPLTAITNTSLLLDFTNAGIIDSTAKNDLETVGNAQISTTQSKWGGSSMSFDGTGDYLTAKSSDLFSFGTGDFTVEFWAYLTNSGNDNGPIFETRSTSTNGLLIRQGNGGGGIANRIDAVITGSSTASSGTISFNTWVHVAVVRSSGTLKVYYNGTGGTGVTATGNITGTNAYIGAFYDNLSVNVAGYFNDIRVTKGYARYTTNFTPPTAAFPTL